MWAEPNTTALYEALALKYRGRLMFVRMPPAENMHLLVDYGLAKALPALGVAETALWDSRKYAFEGEHTFAAISDFCDRVLNGTQPTAIRSEPLPPPLQPGVLGKVVARTLQQVEDGLQAEVLLAFLKGWAQDLEQRNETLAGVARCTAAAGLLVAAFDTSSNALNRSVYPTAESPGPDLDVYLFQTLPNGTRTRTLYPGGRWTRKELLRFLRKHSPAVEQHWAAVVAESDKITEEAKAKEEEVRRERAAREEALKSLPKKELGVNYGEVVKYIKREGTGDLPAEGAVVKAHYTGTLLDGSEFDSSRTRGEPFSFTLGKGQVIGCWDKGLAAMRKGEHAVLSCHPNFAYGASGSPPKIPPNSVLLFDVELLDFEGPSTPYVPEAQQNTDSVVAAAAMGDVEPDGTSDGAQQEAAQAKSDFVKTEL